MSKKRARSEIFMRQSASASLSLLIDAGAVHLKSSQKPGPISESGGSDGLRLSVFVSFIPSCAYSLVFFFPLGDKNINFQPGVAANFLQLTAYPVHHRGYFGWVSSGFSKPKLCIFSIWFFLFVLLILFCGDSSARSNILPGLFFGFADLLFVCLNMRTLFHSPCWTIL